MTESGSRNEGATCGNCGAPVTTADVTCPSCGVLLAAYQAPAGSLGGEIPALFGGEPIPASRVLAAEPVAEAVPSTISPPEMLAPPAQPQHRPASLSPIDDALRQARGEDMEAVALEISAAAAGELAQMATSNSSLAQEVAAELAGAKVTFEGASPAIVATEPAVSATPANPMPAAPGVDAQLVAPAITVSEPARPVWHQPEERRLPVRPSEQAPQVGPPSSRSIQLIPLVVVVVLILVVARTASSFGGLITLVLGVMVVLWLLRLTGVSGRKTTRMPWDNSQDKSRRK